MKISVDNEESLKILLLIGCESFKYRENKVSSKWSELAPSFIEGIIPRAKDSFARYTIRCTLSSHQLIEYERLYGSKDY